MIRVTEVGTFFSKIHRGSDSFAGFSVGTARRVMRSIVDCGHETGGQTPHRPRYLRTAATLTLFFSIFFHFIHRTIEPTILRLLDVCKWLFSNGRFVCVGCLERLSIRIIFKVCIIHESMLCLKLNYPFYFLI